MTVSFPSSRVTLADVPEVTAFRAKFQYNFFTRDEMTNDGGTVPARLLEVPGQVLNDKRIDLIAKSNPRFVRFSFCPVQPFATRQNEFVTTQEHAGAGFATDIEDNIQSIQTEESFSNNSFLGMSFQDDNSDRKFKTIVSGSIAKRVTSHNRLKLAQIEDQTTTIIDGLTDEHSLLDAAKALAEQTSGQVSDNLVSAALDKIQILKLSFIDDEKTTELINDTFEAVKDVTIKAQFNNKIVGTVVSSVVNDNMSNFSDEFSQILSDAVSRQQHALSVATPNVINKDEFDSLFEAIRVQPVDATDIITGSRILGYVIVKYELQNGLTPVKRESIILNGHTSTVAVDSKVAYGKVYVYTIRTIAEVTVRATNDDSTEVVNAVGLIASRRSKRITVSCVENVPPPPPVDFCITWDYKQRAPTLMWSFPTNTQRDIKKFQVFKRNTIASAFQLIHELDFNDAAIKFGNLETPAASSVEVLKSPSTLYTDLGFGKDSSAIYALCSVDAHGLTSNYSMQFDVKFDRFANKLTKELVSSSGAPKAYPNMMLSTDLFMDTIKSSGHSRVTVVFDPEFLEVNDKNGNGLDLIATGPADEKYKLQIINTDVQKQASVDITVKDRRNTTPSDINANSGQGTRRTI